MHKNDFEYILGQFRSAGGEFEGKSKKYETQNSVRILKLGESIFSSGIFSSVGRVLHLLSFSSRFKSNPLPFFNSAYITLRRLLRDAEAVLSGHPVPEGTGMTLSPL